MKLSTRFGLVGLGGLALLSMVQWLREQHLPLGPLGTYFIGVGPNFAAAIAITFVLLGAWMEQVPIADGKALRFRFATSAAISGLGLIGWEGLQMFSRTLVFDWQDVLATLAGIAASTVLFAAVRPCAAEHSSVL